MIRERIQQSDVPAGPRRGLRRPEAARYVGVSPTKFDEWVEKGTMPKPKRKDGCVIWDIRELDLAFDYLSGDDEPVGNSWDDVLG